MSPSVVTSNAEKRIDQVISDQLLVILKPLLAAQRQAKIREVSRQLRIALLGDKEVIKSLRVLVPEFGKIEKEWVTTAQAAEIMGFSRPYMTALLDSSDFAGKVHKSSGGHRRVLASDVRDWMIKNNVHYPLTEEDLASLREPVPSEFFEEEDMTPEEEAVRMKEIELADEESMKYRPRR